MRKVYKLDGEICANCAAKIEDQISKLDGVSKASVSFMAMKFTLEADDAQFDDLLKKSLKIFDKIEPDCEVIVK